MYLEIVGLVIASFFSAFFMPWLVFLALREKLEFPKLLVGGATTHLALVFFLLFEGIFAA